jgi:hypothetical protein
MMAMVKRVWIAQCLCPARHCIMATAGEAMTPAEVEERVTRPLRDKVMRWLLDGTINPWCALCDAKAETWHFETGRTRWASLDDARPELEKNQAEQAVTRAMWGDTHRRKPDA